MTEILINSGIFLIAVLHLWFWILEMFLWQKPLGLKVFRLDRESARISAPLAANQGLYNVFLSAGLFWSILARQPVFAIELKIFFLSCVFIAGAFAGITVNRRIFWVQGLPALLMLCAVLFYRGF